MRQGPAKVLQQQLLRGGDAPPPLGPRDGNAKGRQHIPIDSGHFHAEFHPKHTKDALHGTERWIGPSSLHGLNCGKTDTSPSRQLALSQPQPSSSHLYESSQFHAQYIRCQ